MSSGVRVAAASMELFTQIKMKKDLRFVTYRIKDSAEIVADCTGPKSETWDDFVGHLPQDEPRYALVDIPYQDQEGFDKSKLVFVHWSPDGRTTVRQRMLYASSKLAMKSALTGIMTEVQANDMEDLALEGIQKKLRG